jgi:hypothetical protein
MASSIQHLAAAGPRASLRPPANLASVAASIVIWPRAAAIQIMALIVLSITAILAVMPSALGMIIGYNLLILGRLGIG